MKVNKALSSWRSVKAGVVQRSVIGPLLFIAYFDKLADYSIGRAISLKYADDLILLYPTTKPNVEVELQGVIDGVVNGAVAKPLQFNADKCCYTTLSASTIPYIFESAPKVLDNEVAYGEILRYLGVTLDQKKMTWKVNTREKVGKAKRVVGSLHRLLKNQVQLNVLRNILIGKVLSIFTYGLVVTYPRNKCDRVWLKRLCRFI